MPAQDLNQIQQHSVSVEDAPAEPCNMLAKSSPGW
jgi:hypothetical protein